MQCCSNQSMECSCGSLFTAVGERRVSIGPTQKNSGPRHQRVLAGLHLSNGCQNRHGGLADGHHIEVGTKGLEHRNTVVDVVVEIEPPCRERDLLGISPVSDEDLMSVQEGRDCTPEQGRVMP